MWRSYVRVGLRSLFKNKVYAFINIFGLAVGCAACLLLLIYVRYETSYDEWLPGGENVYQVQSIATDPDAEPTPPQQHTQGVITETLKRDFPQIEEIVRVDLANPVFLRNGEPSFAPMSLTEENFFRVLALPFLRGDPATALASPDALVLSRSEAMNRFGTMDAIGQTVTAVRRGQQTSLRVTGVFEDIPLGSHMNFRLIGRLPEADREDCGWGCANGFVYARLRHGADLAEIHRQLPAWERRAIPPSDAGGQSVSEGSLFDWRFVPVRDVHLSGAEGPLERPGNDHRTIVTFAVVALLILGMAVINFINLATARAGQRAREVALRKVLGARRSQLVAQFLSESLMVVGAAVLIAMVLVELAIPYFSRFLDAELHVGYLGSEGVLLPLLLLWLLVGLAGGLYPAFYLSRFQPAVVLRANKSSAEPIGSGRLRSALVVGQFAVSIGLIVCTLVVWAQTDHAQTADMGVRRDGLIQIANANRAAIAPQTETLMRQIAGVQGVESVAGANLVLASDQELTTNVEVPGRPAAETIGFYSVSPEFFDTLGQRLLAGRFLSRQMEGDNVRTPLEADAMQQAEMSIAARGMNVVINALAAQRLGFADPARAVGQQVRVPLYAQGTVAATIVGVVANGRFRSARDSEEPMMFFDRGIYNNLVVRFAGADPDAVRRQVEAVWDRIAPEVPFEAAFADDRLAALYARDEARGRTFAGFALLAVVIACLGLFGLAAFTAERRTREIGVRKVFGARSRDIVKLLAWQFARPVLLANLIAWPIAWWVMQDWLAGFSTRISLGPGPFLIAGLAALAIALGTITGHALKVSRTNPINALRYE
jgi:putative ABC transport system permease protein